MSNLHPHPQLSTARPHPASLPLFESHSLSRSISPFCCHPVGICGCLFLPLPFCCHPAAKRRELLLSATTAQDFTHSISYCPHCVEYARPSTPPRAPPHRPFHRIHCFSPQLQSPADARRHRLPNNRHPLNHRPGEGKLVSLLAHLLGYHQNLLRQLLSRLLQQLERHLIPRLRQLHHRGTNPAKSGPGLTFANPTTAPKSPKPQVSLITSSNPVSTPRSLAQNPNLTASRPIQYPDPSSPTPGPQPPHWYFRPSLPRPNTTDPVPPITKTPLPPKNAASSAISSSPQTSTSPLTISPTTRPAHSLTSAIPNPATPTQVLVTSCKFTPASTATARSTPRSRSVATSCATRVSFTVPHCARPSTCVSSPTQQSVLVPPESSATNKLISPLSYPHAATTAARQSPLALRPHPRRRLPHRNHPLRSPLLQTRQQQGQQQDPQILLPRQQHHPLVGHRPSPSSPPKPAP